MMGGNTNATSLVKGIHLPARMKSQSCESIEKACTPACMADQLYQKRISVQDVNSLWVSSYWDPIWGLKEQKSLSTYCPSNKELESGFLLLLIFCKSVNLVLRNRNLRLEIFHIKVTFVANRKWLATPFQVNLWRISGSISGQKSSLLVKVFFQ